MWLHVRVFAMRFLWKCCAHEIANHGYTANICYHHVLSCILILQRSRKLVLASQVTTSMDLCCCRKCCSFTLLLWSQCFKLLPFPVTILSCTAGKLWLILRQQSCNPSGGVRSGSGLNQKPHWQSLGHNLYLVCIRVLLVFQPSYRRTWYLEHTPPRKLVTFITV